MRPLQGRLEGGHSTASGRLPPPGRSRGSSRTVPRGAPAGTGPAQPPRRTPHRGGGSTTHARSSPLPPRNVYQPFLGRPGRSDPVNAVRGPEPARGEPDGPCTGGPELARRAVWMMETRSVSRSTAGAVADAIPPSCPHFFGEGSGCSNTSPATALRNALDRADAAAYAACWRSRGGRRDGRAGVAQMHGPEADVCVLAKQGERAEMALVRLCLLPPYLGSPF